MNTTTVGDDPRLDLLQLSDLPVVETRADS